MGLRGPPKTPTQILRLRGSRRAKDREPAIDPPEAIPDCPDWVPADVRDWWQELTEQLGAVHLLTKQDRLTLALLVDAIHQYLALRQIVADNGYVTTTEKGFRLQEPAVGAMDRAWTRILKAAREFGLSPASRAGLSATPKDAKAKDGKSRFFKAV